MDLYEKINRNKKNISPEELIKLLESYGFVFKNKEGSHAHYKRPGYRRFPVPVNQKPLAINIVMNALRLIKEIRDSE